MTSPRWDGWTFPWPLLTLFPLLLSCGEMKAESFAPGSPAAPVEIRAAVAELVEAPKLLLLVGTLAADERVVVSPEVGGIVSELPVDFGDSVERGGLLLRLNADELILLAEAARASVAQTEAVVEQERAEYRRAEKLRGKAIVSDDELERALSQLRVAEANQDAAEKQAAIAEKRVADTVLRAPMSGLVASRHVSVGQYVGPHAQALEILSLDPLRLRVDVPERFSSVVHVEMPITVVLEAFPGERFVGRVTRLGASLAPDTRTLAVEGTIPNPDERLKPGQFAHATLDLGVEPAIVVPRAAIDTFAGTHRSFVVDASGRLEARSITLGRDLGETVVILEGIAAGETVATSHLDRLADGLEIQVASRNPS